MEINNSVEYIKRNIESYCQNKVPDRSFSIKSKNVLFLNEKEFNDLSKSKIINKFNFFKLRFRVLEIAGNFFLAIGGNQNYECNNDDFIEVEISNQLFLGVVETLKLEIKDSANAYEIIDNLSILEISDTYELSQIEQYFEPVNLYQIPEEIATSEDEMMIAIGKIIISSSDIKNLPFSLDTLNTYNEYFNKNKFNYNIINSYASFCWRYCFLDIYRCLEPIFRHLYLPNLKIELSTTKTVDDIGELLYEHCGWRPQEIGSMKSLFKEDGSIVPIDLIQEIRKLELSPDPKENIGNIIYNLRNRIVHYQSSLQDIENELDEQKWDNLIKCLLRVLIELRAKYNCNI